MAVEDTVSLGTTGTRESTTGLSPLREEVSVGVPSRKSALRRSLFVDDVETGDGAENAIEISSDTVSMSVIESMMKRLLKEERDSMQEMVDASMKQKVDPIRAELEHPSFHILVEVKLDSIGVVPRFGPSVT